MQSQLLYNNWFGKAVGATCAWIWAPTDPMWIAVAIITGIVLGHLYDTWAFQQRDDHQHNLSRMGQIDHQAAHMEFLFAALGRIAKVGGRVSPEHIAYAQQLMLQMNLDAAAQIQAKAWFSDGKSSTYPLQRLSRACLAPQQSGAMSRLTTLRCMCHMVSIAQSDAALASLKQLGGYLGFAPGRIAREYGDIRHGNGQTRSTANASNNSNAELKAAFSCLGVAPGSSSTKVKHAYRQLVSRYHPDKLPKDASEQDLQHAQQRMVELRDALERIQNAQS